MIRNFSKTAAILGMAAILMLSVACGGSDDSDDTGGSAPPAISSPVIAATAAGVTPTPVAPTFTAQNFKYAPATVQVKAGATVSWTNKDGELHTVTAGTQAAPTGQFNLQLPAGGTVTQKFDTAGSYMFFCTLHSGMFGEIVVTN